MAILESFIGVAVDGAGKKVDNTEVTTSQGQVHRQATGIVDPETPGGRAKVVNGLPAADGYGLVTREAAPNFDSGLVTLPAADDEITAVDTRVDGIFIHNLTTQVQTVTVKNGLGAFYLNERPLQPKEATFIPLGGVLSSGGIHWNAGAASAVNAQIVGRQ